MAVLPAVTASSAMVVNSENVGVGVFLLLLVYLPLGACMWYVWKYVNTAYVPCAPSTSTWRWVLLPRGEWGPLASENSFWALFASVRGDISPPAAPHWWFWLMAPTLYTVLLGVTASLPLKESLCLPVGWFFAIVGGVKGVMYLVCMPAPSRFVNVLRSGAYLSLGINKACVLVGLAEGADICAVIVEAISIVEIINTVALFGYKKYQQKCLNDHRPAGEDGVEMRSGGLEERLMGTSKSHAPLPLAQPQIEL